MGNLNCQRCDGGVKLDVRVTPSAKRSMVGGNHDGCLKVSVTAAPDQGKANDAVIKILSERLGIAKSHIEITAGSTSRRKSIYCHCDDADALICRLMELAN